MNFQQNQQNQNLLAKSFGNSATQRRGIKINKLIMFESGTYNTQYRRPYTTNLTGDVFSTIQESVGNSTSLNNAAFAGVATQFLHPTSNPESTVPIANGWTERRMRFLMEIENSFNVGAVTTEMVQGYTTHLGVTTAGTIDPNMEFYINSVVQIRTVQYNSPVGMQSISSIYDSSHILANNNFEGAFAKSLDQRLRPSDVLTTMGRTHVPDPAGLIDLRTSVTNIAAKSRRTNNNPTNYLSSLVGNYQKATRSLTDSTVTANELLENARDGAKENLVAEDPFLMALSQVRNTGIGNVFTYADLKRIYPDVDHVTHARYMDATAKAVAHSAGQTAEWGASDRVTTVASILSNAVPALLMELGLMKVVFKSSNRHINAEVLTLISDAKTFSDGDKSKVLSAFIVNLELYILRDISFNNQTDFAISMQVDLLGETWMSISIDGLPSYDFVTPSFADSLLTPVITGNSGLAMQIANDFEDLTRGLIEYSNDDVFGNKVGNFGNL